MDKKGQIQFVKNCFETLYAECDAGHPSLLKGESKRLCGLSEEDGGVPAEMEVGTPDEEGYVKWKLIPSTLTDKDIDGLEEECGFAFPGLYRTFLTTYFHLFEELTGVWDQASDNPLVEEYDPFLASCNYLAFASDLDDYSIICIDVSQMPNEELCSVCKIDHDILYGFDETSATRKDVEKEMLVMHKNLKAFLEDVFLGNK